MRTVILGGTFNPIHNGHINLAIDAINQLGYERVIFVPSHTPAHKTIKEDISPNKRFEMVEVAIEPYTNFFADRCEILRTGVSYSIDTVDCVYGKYSCTGKAGLIIGDDLVPGFSKWKDAEELSSRVDLVIAHRSTTEQLPLDYPHTYLDNSIWKVSSSEIRDKYRRGEDITSLVPTSVLTFIHNEGLYQIHEDKEAN
ncbi:nicotinate (nicotinamide) nucleotide adenylyltransferase [Spirochaeta cellobiosiphila]|uniref:nicotinate (nicotinamide) nucleotide adenylyltransferase n=1 Tax=Spirochaeta cellobiosiphila TaxID=504483 RepID=UPI00042475AF|nr:nicotinate (nicotinamide) nucleotide adenylyltransferase [Spirochaeta cellobiosiphila]